jgi:hypothetical protein
VASSKAAAVEPSIAKWFGFPKYRKSQYMVVEWNFCHHIQRNFPSVIAASREQG